MPVFMNSLKPPQGSTVDPVTGALITPSHVMGVMEFLGSQGVSSDVRKSLESLINPGQQDFDSHFAKQGPAKFQPTQYPGGAPSDLTGADRTSMNQLRRQQQGMNNRNINKTNQKNAYTQQQRQSLAAGNMEMWADPRTGQTMTRQKVGDKYVTAAPKGWKRLDFNVEGADAQKLFAAQPGRPTAGSLIRPQQGSSSPSSSGAGVNASVQAVRNLGDSERGGLQGGGSDPFKSQQFDLANKNQISRGGVKPAFGIQTAFSQRAAFPAMGVQL